MPRLRPLRKQEDIEKVPRDQPVLVDVAEDPKTVAEAANGGSPPEPPEPLEPPKEDESEALKLRLSELERAEKLARESLAERERQIENLRRRAEEAESQRANSETSVVHAQYDAVLSSLEAAQNELGQAQSELEQAEIANDIKAKVAAQTKIGRAAAKIDKYEDNKLTIEADMERRKSEVKQVYRPTVDEFINNMQVPESAKMWLRAHPDYVTNQNKLNDLGHLHWNAEKKGIRAFSPEYFEYIEIEEGLRKKEARVEEEEDDKVVSVPPTREPVSMGSGRPINTRITLTPEQREVAKAAGVSELEYAKNLLKLQQMKKDGSIQ